MSIFDQLKRDYSNSLNPLIDFHEPKDSILEKMRENLLERNNGNNVYVFQYTQKEKEYEIASCDFNQLCEIDGDMRPMGM